jgi:hypothetical protein
MDQDCSREAWWRLTPDRGDPWDHNRLFDVRRLLGFHGFHVWEGDVWGDPGAPVPVAVEDGDELIEDRALIRAAVASGVPDPHTLVAVYAAELRDRWHRRRGRRGRRGAQ